MNITKASPTDWYRLKASFGPGYIDHPLEIKISHGKEVDSQTGRWREGKELGRGGFGTVRLEREENKGDVRALKLIYKRSIPGGFDYRRELLAMASLDKVGSRRSIVGDRWVYIATDGRVGDRMGRRLWGLRGGLKMSCIFIFRWR